MVQRILVLLFMATGLAACSPVVTLPTLTPAPTFTPTTPPETTVTLGNDFTLGVGQIATLDQDVMKITFVRVDSDSRCPPDPQIQCIWAGEVKVTIEIEMESITGNFPLTLSGGMDSSEPMNLNGYAITLKAVEPQPAAEKQVDPASYRATFIIDKAP
jgi:hypothetical protein